VKLPWQIVPGTTKITSTFSLNSPFFGKKKLLKIILSLVKKTANYKKNTRLPITIYTLSPMQIYINFLIANV
jgi:hypothetical protein